MTRRGNPVLRGVCGAACVAVAAAFVIAAGPVLADDALADPSQFEASAADGPRYGVAGFRVAYSPIHPRSDLFEHVPDLVVELGQVKDGYVAPRPGVPVVGVVLRAAPYTYYYESALRAIDEQVAHYLGERGAERVALVPSASDVAPGTGLDLRGAGQTSLTLVVREGGTLPDVAAPPE